MILPETTIGMKRESLSCLAEFVWWLNQNEPNVFKTAIKAIGEQKCKRVFNELEDHVQLWE